MENTNIIHDFRNCKRNTIPVFDEHYDENGEFIRFVEYPVVVIPMKESVMATFKEVKSIPHEDPKRRVDYIFSDELSTIGKEITYQTAFEKLLSKKVNTENIYVKFADVIYVFAFGETCTFY